MDRLGIGYKVLATHNPRLVYCAISGFGQTGPDALFPAYDQIIQGLSGEMAVNGDERLSPLRTGFPVCDTVGGLNAAFAVMAALFHRERTGEGQFIDVALLDSIMPLMGWVAANLLIGKQQPVLMGNDNFTAAPSGTFRTADGFINIAANKQEQWEAVCDVLGLPALKKDPRFEERDTRKKNRKALTPLLEEKLATKPTAAWVAELNAADVPSGAILGLEEALRQPQVVHRDVLKKVPLAGFGDIEVFGLTAQFEKTPGAVDTPPPELGEHNAAVFTALGIPAAEQVELKAKGVI
jgi:formyl-CoA transferase